MNITFNVSPFHAVLKADEQGLSPEAAWELAASLPKSVRPRSGQVSKMDRTFGGYFYVEADIQANETNGGANEAGIKRLNNAIKRLAAQGHTIEFTTPYTNSLTEQQACELGFIF